jgi:hypothetical protein
VRLKKYAVSVAALLLVFTVAQPVIATRRFSHEVQEARAYALQHIGKTQFKCLDILFERESHWNPRSGNVRTGPYGIPQAFPSWKMAKAGRDWQTNPTTQIKWGLMYIKSRYGTACSALNHSYVTGWY